MAEEKEIERRFVEIMERTGWKAPKLVCPGFNGMPDRLILKGNGQVFFAEIKAPGEQPRALQESRIRMLRDAGYRVYVVDSVEMAREVRRTEALL